MRTLIAAALATAVAAPAAAQTHTTVTRTTRPGVTVTTHTPGYAPPVYAAPVYASPAPQDGPYLPYEPLPTDAEVFGGIRIEAQIGFDRIGGDDQVLFGSDDNFTNGFSYGGEAGFDVPLGRTLLVGGYVGVEGSTVEECFTLIGGSGCSRAPWSFTAGGRVGLAAGRNLLIYGKGGYSRGRVELESTRVTNPPSTVDFGQTLDGFHAGGGLETRFGRNAYGKIEYVYTRLRGFDAVSLPGVPDDEFDRHQVKVGLGLRL